jgi:hypothetical protein
MKPANFALMKPSYLFVLSFPIALVAACTATVTSTPSPQADSGTDGSTPVTKKDGGGGGGGMCDRVPTVAEYDALYKPATAQTLGACTAADVAAIKAAATYQDAVDAAKKNPTCGACVVSKQSDAKWGTLILDTAGDLVHVNFGTCSEVASGNAECGKVDAKYYSCSDLTCGECASQDDYDACISASYGSDGTCVTALSNGDFGTCSDADTAKIVAACGEEDLGQAVQYLCGSGGTAPADAGRD